MEPPAARNALRRTAAPQATKPRMRVPGSAGAWCSGLSSHPALRRVQPLLGDQDASGDEPQGRGVLVEGRGEAQGRPAPTTSRRR